MSTTMWISRARLPAIVTWPTPLTVWIAREICLSAISVSVRRLIVSEDTISDITGSASGSTLVITGGSSSRRHALDRAGDLLAHVVDGVVEVALEHEADGDVGLALADARRDLVDAGDAADRLLHRLDDRRRHLVGARAGQRQRDVDRRRIGAREEIDAEVAEREDAEHHQRHHQHRGEHGTADAEFRQHAYSTRLSTVTFAPSTSFSTSVTATGRRP